LDHLWSPWRLDYVTAGKPSAGCVFCLAAEAAGGAGAPDRLGVFRGVTAYVVLNRYPYNNGHVMVVPRRHVATLMELSAEELQEVALLTQRAEAALGQAYRLEGINIGINLGKAAGAGIHEHLHVHLVPRWSGDTNFMTVVGDTRVLPEDLASAAARLSPIFAKLSGRGG
jgi:ATP adenylyltransferase